MLINDLRTDFKSLMKLEKENNYTIGDKLKMPPSNVYRASGKFNQKFIELCDALGYDVKLVYVKKATNE